MLFRFELDHPEMEIFHDSGPSAEAERLQISGDGIKEGEGMWYQAEPEQYDPESTVAEGDSVTILIEKEYDVSISYIDPEYGSAPLSRNSSEDTETREA